MLHLRNACPSRDPDRHCHVRGAQYAAYFVMAAVLTVLTSNDIVILTLTPVIYHFSRATGIDPAPLLFLEFFTANVWSMALLIGGSFSHSHRPYNFTIIQARVPSIIPNISLHP